ncbi:MAG: hypothetical protein Kilf2KO_08610 [Rhodospirillales bacterium]
MLLKDEPPRLAPWTDDAWSAVLGYANASSDSKDPPETSLSSFYHPLMIARRRGKPLCLGQLGQSLDGRIATESGHSHYINGRAALIHLHCLRALVDAVVVGVGTALADDPQLTVRLIEGPNPARVVIDPRGRLPAEAACWRDDGCRRVLIHGGGATTPAGVTGLALPLVEGRLRTADIKAALADLGLARLLIEGGAGTVSAFLQSGDLDRLHILTGPLIIGSGKPGILLPPIARLDAAIRPQVTVQPLPGGDCLFDCALQGSPHDAASAAGQVAKRSA